MTETLSRKTILRRNLSENKKAFSQSQIDKVTELLLEAQGAASAADAK